MPKVSEFYGIRIRMWYKEHHGPHFHAEYGEFEAQISIRDGAVLSGKLPGRAYRLVLEWLELHRSEMQENWERARRHEPVVTIAGLD